MHKGQPTFEERDTLFISDYLPRGEEIPYFEGPDLPRVALGMVKVRLVMVTDEGFMINPEIPTLYKYGVTPFVIAGHSRYDGAWRGNLSPGSPLRLGREPDNQYDSNAVAVYPFDVDAKAGYIPKGKAKRVAKLLDSGTHLVCISLRGEMPGKSGNAPTALVAGPSVIEHLTRNL